MKKHFSFDNNTNTVFVIEGGKIYRYTLQPNEYYNIINNHIVRMTEDGVLEMKFCSHCGNWEPIGNFYKNKKSRDGYASRCIKCANEKPQVPELIDHSDLEENTMTGGEWPRSINTLGQSFNAMAGSLPLSFGTQSPKRTAIADPMSELLIAQNREQKSIINEQLAKIKELEAKNIELARTINPLEGKTIEELTEEELRNYLKSGKVDPKIIFEALGHCEKDFTFTCTDYLGRECALTFGHGRMTFRELKDQPNNPE